MTNTKKMWMLFQCFTMRGKIDFSNISGADWFWIKDIGIWGWGKLEIYQE